MMSGRLCIAKYEILGEVGRGAMGTVYRARDPVLDRIVAIKTIMTGSPLQEEGRERFLREARSAARLQHPNIVTVHELGEFEGAPFIAMEYLEGVDLATAAQSGRLASVASRLLVMRQVCVGLGYAHAHGVIHRDVKPGNVILLADGTAKIVDFGIAWLEGGTFATRTGMLLGTPSYMAPEQFGESGVDHRVDQWAVGVMLYELVAGRRPFEGSTVPSLIYRVVHGAHQPLDAVAPGLPAGLSSVVSKALAKSPQQRFADMDALAAELGRFLEGPFPAGQPRLSAPEPFRSPRAALDVALTAATRPGSDSTPSPPSALLHRDDTFSEVATFGEPAGLVVILAAPDERTLAVGCSDGTTRLWALATMMRVATLRGRLHLRTGHASLVTSLAYSADGTLLAAGHLDGAIELWDVASGFEHDVRFGHEGAVVGLAFAPDGVILASAGKDATVKIWEVAALLAGEGRRVMRRQPTEVTCMAMSPDGGLLVTGHTNRSLRVHETASGRLKATLHGLHAAPSCLAISPDARLVAAGDRDRMIRVFDLETRGVTATLEGHSRSVSSIVFLSNGRQLASVAHEAGVLLWDSRISYPVLTLPGRGDDSFASIGVLDGGGRVVAGLTDGRLRLWSLR